LRRAQKKKPSIEHIKRKEERQREKERRKIERRINKEKENTKKERGGIKSASSF